MNYTVSISQFRRDLFTYAKKVFEHGHELEVVKDGKAMFKVVRADEDDSRARAKRVLELSKKLVGKWKDVDFDREFFRGAKERKYWQRLEEEWKK